MSTYSGDASTFSENIYIFDEIDSVLGGIDGTTNVPIKQLADNTSHLKKFKGTLLKGTGAPSDSSFPAGFVVDANTNANTLFLDESTGSFWKRTGTNTWQNISKGCVLNVKGLHLNDNGSEADSVFLSYDSTNGWLELRNHTDSTYADLRVGKLKFDTADGYGGAISKFIDKEIIVLSGVSQFSENSDGFFSVKNLIDQTGAVQIVQSFADHGVDRIIVTAAPTVVAGDHIQLRGLYEPVGETKNGFYKVLSVSHISPYWMITLDSTFVKMDITGDSSNPTFIDDGSSLTGWSGTGTITLDGTLGYNTRTSSIKATKISVVDGFCDTGKSLANVNFDGKLLAFEIHVPDNTTRDILNGALSYIDIGPDGSNFKRKHIGTLGQTWVTGWNTILFNFDSPDAVVGTVGSGALNTFIDLEIHCADVADTFHVNIGDIRMYPVLALESGAYAKDNSAQLRFDNTNDRFELRRRDGTLLGLNVSTFYIDGVPLQFIANRVIASQAGFDELFNQDSYSAQNECWLRKPEDAYVTDISDEYIYIKKSDAVDGWYTLSKLVVIRGSNVKIEFAPGVVVKYDNTVSQNVGFKFRDDTQLPIYHQYDRYVQVLSGVYYNNAGPYKNNYTSNLPVISAGDRPFIFSDERPDVFDRKFTVQDHGKEFSHSGMTASWHNSATLHTIFDSCYANIDGTDYLYFTDYFGSTLRIGRVGYDAITLVPNATITWVTSVSVGVTSRVRIFVTQTYACVVFGGFDLGMTGISVINFDPSSLTQIGGLLSIAYNLRGFNAFMQNGVVHIAGQDMGASAGDYLYYTKVDLTVGSPAFTSPIVIGNFGSAIMVVEKVGIVANGTNVQVSHGTYSGGNFVRLVQSYNSGATWGVPTNIWLASDYGLNSQGPHGRFVDMVVVPHPTDVGQFISYVAFAYFPLGAVSNVGGYGCISVSESGTFVAHYHTGNLGTTTNIDDLSIYANTNNVFLGKELITIAICDGGAGPGAAFSTSFVNTAADNNVNHPFTQFIINSADWAGQGRVGRPSKWRIIHGTNNYAFTIGVDGGGAFGQCMYFVNTVIFAETLEIVTTPVVLSGSGDSVFGYSPFKRVLSNDYCEKCEIKGLNAVQLAAGLGPFDNIQAGYYSGYVGISNSLFCKVTDLNVTQGTFIVAIGANGYGQGIGKNYGSLISGAVIDTCVIPNGVIDHVSHSMITEFMTPSSTLAMGVLSGCRNCSVSGFLPSNSLLTGSGDFNLV